MFLPKLYPCAAMAALSLSAWSLFAGASSPAMAAEAAHTLPAHPATCKDHGRIEASRPIEVTVHLKKENEAGFRSALAALYDPQSPTFHHWMTDEELRQYEPAADKVFAVRKELESHGLTVVANDRHHFTLRARGSAADMEAAFHTELHEFESRGRLFRANVQAARLSGAAGDAVSLVAGLEDHRVRPMSRQAIVPGSGKPAPALSLARVEVVGLGSIITDQAMSSGELFNFTTPGAALPTGTFYGDLYDSNPSLTVDFTPLQLQDAYGLAAVYAQGLKGAGQTIVLLEAYGYPQAEADANAFSALTSLPALNASNFSIVYPDGAPFDPGAGAAFGWDTEIALDIDWAHSIAPGAKIVVVVAASEYDADLQSAISYVIDNNVGYTVSDSWVAAVEDEAGPAEDQVYENLMALAAAKGISFQFSSGDDGDNGVGTPLGAEAIPANAPHATGVGGTALLNTPSGFLNVGWGDAEVTLNDSGVQDPPVVDGFLGGAGGGQSLYFAKPLWQSKLPGKGRQVPDVSALADPYTGVPIVITRDGTQMLELGWGGTSLASPIFSAIWALADEYNGKPLGQAAPVLSTLNAYHLTDVTGITPNITVAGSITDPTGTHGYPTATIFKGMIYGATGFMSAIWPVSGELDYAFAFGLDTSLTVTSGWDNVTGYGTPNGLRFLNGVTGRK